MAANESTVIELIELGMRNGFYHIYSDSCVTYPHVLTVIASTEYDMVRSNIRHSRMVCRVRSRV
jgi:hypothetical protein